jgi:hypothetical protein
MAKKTAFLMVLALTVSSAAFAGSITFDPFPSIPAGVTVQYFNAGLTGPLSTLPAPNTVALAPASSAVPSGGNALLTWYSSLGPYGVLFTFSAPVTSFSLIGNDFGGSSVGDNEFVNLSLFDSGGSFLYSASANAPYAVPNLQPISVTGPAAKYVAFTWTNDLGYYAIDNVTYESRGGVVPEPSALILLGTGLGGLCLAAWRRKK